MHDDINSLASVRVQRAHDHPPRGANYYRILFGFLVGRHRFHEAAQHMLLYVTRLSRASFISVDSLREQVCRLHHCDGGQYGSCV